MADPLEGGYPALWDAADSSSLTAQRQFLWALRARLGGLLVAAVGGGVFLGIGLTTLGGLIAITGFLAALGSELYSALTRPDRRWYEGRAAAESIKTLAWRYAVRGESFDGGFGETDIDSRFVRRVDDVLHDLDDLELESSEALGEQITDPMRALRAEGFDARRDVYKAGRIEDQRKWYSRKASWNRARQTRWTFALILMEFVGVLGGVFVVVFALPIDLLGLLAAAAGGGAAWVQARQHATLSTAYGITAQELASIASEVGRIDEEHWASFVGQAEEAISREHTLWRASRGTRSPGSRR